MKKKILVWITTDFIQFLVASHLQKFEDYELYAIIDCPSNAKNFFKQQKIVKFKQIWFLHEQINQSKSYSLEKLENFEKEYELNLWELITNERIFYKYNTFYNFNKDTILSIDYQILIFFENILKTISPDALLTKEPGFHHLEILTKMCKKKFVKVLFPFVPKITNRVSIGDDSSQVTSKINYNDFPFNKKTFSELQTYFKNKTKKLSPSENMQKYVKTYSSSTTSMKFKAFLKYFFSSSKSEHELYTYYGRNKIKVLFIYLSLFLKKAIRKSFIDKNLSLNPTLNRPFVYFALGVDLEQNLLIGSPILNNQIEIIRTIVKSLPVNYSLYVKETPAQATREWRSISDYKELIKIPNVTLIHPEFSSKKLLDNSSLVMTISGSTSFEAALCEKPSIVFSKTIYSLLPSVKLVTDLVNLRNEIKNSLEISVQSSDVSKYIDFIEKNSIEWPFDEFDIAVVNKFHYSGLLLDTEINETSMQEFITENQILIEKLAMEFHNSINK